MTSGLSVLDFDTQKAVFSAAVMMSLFFGICLLSRIVLWVFFSIATICAIYTGIMFFKNGNFKGFINNGKKKVKV